MSSFLEDCRQEILAVQSAFRVEQLEGFLRMEPDLCGVPVVPLTPRIALELELAGNAFFSRGQPLTAEDVVQFVHRISVGYRAGDRKQIRRLSRLLYDKKAPAALQAYLERSHGACPSYGKKESKDVSLSDACWASYLVDRLSHRYGWSVDQVLDTPYRIIWQMFQRIMEEQDPDYTQRAPGLAKISEQYMDKQLAKIRAEEALKYGK